MPTTTRRRVPFVVGHSAERLFISAITKLINESLIMLGRRCPLSSLVSEHALIYFVLCCRCCSPLSIFHVFCFCNCHAHFLSRNLAHFHCQSAHRTHTETCHTHTQAYVPRTSDLEPRCLILSLEASTQTIHRTSNSISHFCVPKIKLSN